MKIQAPQSQNSFKAIYKPANATYTEEQIKIINDINSKLKKDIDIFIKPNDTNSINLYKLDGIEKDENEKLNYKTCKFIGTYNEENPFKFKDTKKYDLSNLVHLAPIALGLISLIGVSLSSIIKIQNPQYNSTINKEIYSSGIKDTLNSITKDSLKITQKIMRK